MNRIALALLTLALSLAPVLCWAAEPKTDEVKAIAEIEKLGGRVTRDEGSPGKPVIDVDLGNSQVTDAGLVHLKGLPQLQSLCLYGTQVTDAGLVHLKGLTRLQSLNLATPQVTDAGLVHLEGLTQLQSLVVGGTQVTDAGLVHLKGLTDSNRWTYRLSR